MPEDTGFGFPFFAGLASQAPDPAYLLAGFTSSDLGLRLFARIEDFF
jgi:hypothetical protein